MPPLTATPKALEPVVLALTASIDEPRDAWLEKVFGPRRTCKDGERLESSVYSDSDEEEHSYREELQKYITEATANLNEEPLDEDSSDDESESPGSDVFDFDSDDDDDYVEPPVDIPRGYRTQDLQGGMIVGGDCVLFTNWAFKRLLQRRRRLPRSQSAEILEIMNSPYRMKRTARKECILVHSQNLFVECKPPTSTPIQSRPMLVIASIVGLVLVSAVTDAADPSCGVQYSTMNTEGDVVGTVLYPASPEVCCANCTANPDCQFFVTDDGGWRGIEPKCRLVSRAQTMYDYLHGSYGKNTVVMSGREIPAWGKCGDQNGFKLCSQGFYCQPWDSNYYQCIQKPSKCEVYTNVDLYGNDLKRIQGIKPGECCDECDKTIGCRGYTYVNDDPRGTQCYLKNSVDGWVKKVGVHSGTMPKLPAWSKCGDSTGFRPCTDDFYCQPWDWSYYQCIQRPRCSVETDIDYYGNDIKKVTNIGPGECCEECGKTEGCDSYTYINDDPSGTQCYLKHSNEGRTRKVGALSGLVMPGMK